MKRANWKALALITTILTCVIFLTSGTVVRSVRSLPEQYVSALKGRLGMRYAAAGDSGGISCSALVRQALLETTIDAETRQTVKRLQCLSGELLRGCGGQLSLVQTAENLHQINYEQMQPGDVAILGDGIHSLAFLKERQWIHSDQVVGQVIILDESTGSGGWFFYPVTVMRWNALSAVSQN